MRGRAYGAGHGTFHNAAFHGHGHVVFHAFLLHHGGPVLFGPAWWERLSPRGEHGCHQRTPIHLCVAETFVLTIVSVELVLPAPFNCFSLPVTVVEKRQMPARLVRLAAIQDAPVSFSLPESIKKFASLVATAASAPYSADVLVFPEAFLSCYPRGHDFGAVIGSRSDEGREWFKLYYESSVDIEGNSPESWQEILKRFCRL